MPLHVKRITGDVHYEIRLFAPGRQYGQRFDVGLNVNVYSEYLEVGLMSGRLSLRMSQIKELLTELRDLRKQHGLPVLAQRMDGALPGFVRLCGNWWNLRD